MQTAQRYDAECNSQSTPSRQIARVTYHSPMLSSQRAFPNIYKFTLQLGPRPKELKPMWDVWKGDSMKRVSVRGCPGTLCPPPYKHINNPK